MPTPRILRTATFRLAMAFAVVFAAGAFVLLLALQWAVGGYARQATDDALRAEMALVQAQGAHEDAASLARELALRAQSPGARPLFYLVVGPDGRALGGNLPSAAFGKSGFGQVVLPAPADSREFDSETMTVRTLAEPGAHGMLVIGRDTYALDELDEWLGQVTLWGGAGLTVLALAGGLLAGALFLSRLERVNSAAERIMSGGLDQRLPAIGFGAEFDRLSASLNRMLDRLQASMDSLRQVSADVAHDLRTPLGHLRQRLERARLESVDAEACRAAMDAAITDIDEVLSIFNSLLRIAQLEGGTGREQFAAMDLSAVLVRVIEVFRPAAEDEGRALEILVEPGMEVFGDPVLLGQLFSNLIENALTHTPPGTRITVSARRDRGQAVVVVADAGPGVPVAELSRITGRFYRLDRSRSTPGAGLGLAMAAAISDLHRARLRFEDNRPGLMAELRFDLAEVRSAA